MADPLITVLALIGAFVVVRPFTDKVAESIVLALENMLKDRRP